MKHADGGPPPSHGPPGVAPPRAGATRRVHVLCAPPYGRNPGMSTVDLGLVRLGSELGGSIDLRCWRLWDDSEWRKPARRTAPVGPGLVHDLDSGLGYHLVRGREEEFADADLLLYWGDFHHMSTYQRSTVDVLTRELAAPLTVHDAAEQARRVLLQEGAGADVRARTLSYGTTLMMNSPDDYGPAYQHLLQEFVRGARRVWFRDPYSASVGALLRQDDASCHGVDAAVLAGILPATPGTGTMEVFLGRSRLLPEEVALFGRALARATGTRPRWLPWGKEPAFTPLGSRPRFRRAWRDAAPGADQEIPLGELLDRVQDASLVLTDTYHLAVNAWRLGTPAILLVDDPGGPSDVNGGSRHSHRDKRRDLYSQWEALPLLVHLPSVRGRHGSEARRLAEHLCAPEALGVTWGRLRALEERALSMLLQELVPDGWPVRRRASAESRTSPARAPVVTAGRE